MKKNKKRKQVIIATIIILGIIILGFGAYFYSFKDSDTLYFFDKNGLSKLQVIRTNIITGLLSPFRQTVFDPRDNVVVGNTVSLRDDYKWASGNIVATELKYDLYKDGVLYKTLYKTLNPSFQPGQQVSATYFWVTEEAGTYTIETFARESSTASWKKITDPNPEEWKTVTVTNPDPETCDKQAYCDNYVDDSSKTSNNGQVQKKDCYKVDDVNNPNCNHVFDKTEYKTVCNQGYVIIGTSQTFSDGIKNCELLSQVGSCTTDSDCTGTEICNPSTDQCQVPDCTADQITTCSDGTNVTTATCTNGVSTTTSNVCTTSNQNNTNQTTNNTSTSTTTITEPEINWVLWSLIGGVIVIILIIIALVVVRKK